MATKRNHSAAKVLQKKADDAVVYQVMVALVLLCCCFVFLRPLCLTCLNVASICTVGIQWALQFQNVYSGPHTVHRFFSLNIVFIKSRNYKHDPRNSGSN